MMVSVYSPDNPCKVYLTKERQSDNRDPMIYGRDFDFSRPFFEQFNELNLDVPKFSLFTDTTTNINSDYANEWWHIKDSYFVFNVDFLEWCLYCSDCHRSQNLTDCERCSDSQNCYESQDLTNCSSLKNSINCNNCSYSEFLTDCEWCKNCFYCFNLTNQEYNIWNVKYTKEEYEKIIKDRSLLKETIETNLWKIDKNMKNYRGYWNEDVFGDGINKSKYIKLCFNITDGENIAYSDKIWWSKDVYDIYAFGNNIQLNMEWCSIWENSYKSSFNYGVAINVSEIFYSICCLYSSNLFGCVWLRNKQYCIFNKQYTKEEYEELVPKIIEHMKKYWERWEYFPIKNSTYGYNETMAHQYFPLTRDQAIAKWYKWQDNEYPINIPEGIELLQTKDLPDNISDVEDNILNKAIICEVSGKPFRIVKPELEFYRKHNLPLPRKHPEVRHLERFNETYFRNLYLRKCDNCGKEVISVYPQNSDFKVYCEECYNKNSY